MVVAAAVAAPPVTRSKLLLTEDVRLNRQRPKLDSEGSGPAGAAAAPAPFAADAAAPPPPFAADATARLQNGVGRRGVLPGVLAGCWGVAGVGVWRGVRRGLLRGLLGAPPDERRGEAVTPGEKTALRSALAEVRWEGAPAGSVEGRWE